MKVEIAAIVPVTISTFGIWYRVKMVVKSVMSAGAKIKQSHFSIL